MFPPFACNLIYFLGAFLRATACSELSILQYCDYVNVQFRHFLTFVFKHFSQKRFWVRVFVRNFCALIAGRYVSRGRMGDTHFRSRYASRLRFCTKLCFETFYTRRNRRNAPSMARFSSLCVPAGAFLCFIGIISTVSKSLRYALLLKRVSPHPSPAYVPYVVAEYSDYWSHITV